MNNNSLKFKDGKFKIMLLCDLHENYDLFSAEAKNMAEDSTSLISKAVDELKPDLVIYMGDNASANNEMEMRSVISRIVYPVSVREIPMAFVFGNHDRECSVPLETQMKLYNEHENCYFYNADSKISGYGNYNLLVKSSDEKKDILNLWFMDSNNRYPSPDASYYDNVHADQIEWYKKTAKSIANKHGKKVVPALLFQHIPVPEEYELLREAKQYEILDSVKGHRERSDKNYVLKDFVEGYLGEGPCVPSINSGEFESWKEVGDIMGAFFGHDHMNDFAGYVDGILLAQSKTAGFRPYTDGCRAGVRLITMHEDNIENIDTKMYHFKEFGLKSKSLDTYKRNVTDRQDTKIKIASAAVGTVAAVTVATVAVKAIKKQKNK